MPETERVWGYWRKSFTNTNTFTWQLGTKQNCGNDETLIPAPDMHELWEWLPVKIEAHRDNYYKSLGSFGVCYEQYGAPLHDISDTKPMANPAEALCRLGIWVINNNGEALK